MLTYLEFALINAMMIVPLAILSEIAGRTFRRPTLTHLLWVLILVKLVTPPLWQVPLIDREWLVTVGQQLIPPVLADVDTIELRQRLAGLSEDSIHESQSQPSPRPRPRSLADQDRRMAARDETIQSYVTRSLRSQNLRLYALAVLLNVWALGALTWFVVQGMRCIRFRLALQQGCAAGTKLQRTADVIAQRMGLAQAPTVWLMPGVMSPMLWGCGRSPLLVFPELLLDRLDEEATATLLTHELSHFRRRDHWVRVLALVTTGLFWWHPGVWWARREIEAAEEECCDAMVVSIAPSVPRRYAQAILDVVDFLAEQELRMPALATGIGQVPFLRQRLTWIMSGPRRQDIGLCGWGLCALLVCLLPLQPSWVGAQGTLLPATVSPMAQLSVPWDAISSVAPMAGDPVASPVTEGTKNTDSAEGEPGKVTRWSGSEVQAQSSDGRLVVVGNEGFRTLLDLEAGREIELIDFSIEAMAFGQGSREFVSVSRDGMLRLWNTQTLKIDREWKVPGGDVKTVDLSADSSWIATGGRDGVVRIWNRSADKVMQEFPRELAPINCVRFSPYSALLAVATGDWMSPRTGRIALVDSRDWSEVISMNWNSPAAVVAFHADGDSLVSGDWQGRVARWSLSTGELLGLSRGHEKFMAAAQFSSTASPLLEIDVPDLPSHWSWNEVEPGESGLRIFSRWGFYSLYNLSPASASSMSAKR
ncbi:M56 family metallopeptidase [Schlesneria sp. DSM 10557]|uniref:M56 family metallopeptidase n=1 Tax=Schlesneria sp. DSM 10557 TaxID=3044399 RepID=UPI00359F4B93